MDPFSTPVPTRHQVVQAKKDQAVAFLTAVSAVGLVATINRALNAPGGKLVQKLGPGLFTGLEQAPSATGRATTTVSKFAPFGALLPTPLGYVPPEFYGLHPEVVMRTVGRPIGSKPLGFEATEARKVVFEARKKADEIGARALGLDFRATPAFGPERFQIPPGRIPITRAEAEFLAALPPGVSEASKLVPQLIERASDLQPDAPGSTQPASVQPVTDAAIRNMLAALGLRRELVSERADP